MLDESVPDTPQDYIHPDVPEQTDNRPREEDGDQDVDQDPSPQPGSPSDSPPET